MLSSLSETIVSLPGMTISEPVNIPSGVDIEGRYAGQDASTGDRASSVDPADETIFTESVTLNGSARLDGVTLKARPEIKDATSVTIENSRILDVTVPSSGSHMDRAVVGISDSWDKVVTLKIDGCYFGDNANVYNLMEPNVQLGNNTSISNNYFTAAATSHNYINIYAVEDGAKIVIKDNQFEKSANAIRLGPKGDKQAEVVMDGNAYDQTDSDPNWAGLLLIQPYGKQTISMKDVKIKLDDTINNSDQPQLFYLYEGTNDTHLEPDGFPELSIDGEILDWNNLDERGQVISK